MRVRAILVNMGAAGIDKLPPSPLNMTAPFCARALPSKVEPAFIVMEAYAMIVPLKTEEVPSVAELPTCQKMFLAWAPPVKITLLSADQSDHVNRRHCSQSGYGVNTPFRETIARFMVARYVNSLNHYGSCAIVRRRWFLL